MLFLSAPALHIKRCMSRCFSIHPCSHRHTHTQPPLRGRTHPPERGCGSSWARCKKLVCTSSFRKKMPLAKHVVTQLLIPPTFPSTAQPVSQWYSTAFPNTIGEVSLRVECSTAVLLRTLPLRRVSPRSPDPILHPVGQEQLKPLIWLLHEILVLHLSYRRLEHACNFLFWDTFSWYTIQQDSINFLSLKVSVREIA